MAGKADISAGRAFVELFVKQGALVKGLRVASDKLKAWGSSVRSMGTMVAGVGATITAPFAAAVTSFVSTGDQLNKMAARTRMSTEALSELGFAAEQNGSSLNDVGNAMFRAGRRIANAATGTGPAARAMKELGLNAAEVAALPMEKQFMTMVGALEQVENPGRRAQMAFEVFGDQAKVLMPLLDQGVDGINALRKEAQDLGVTKSTEATTMAADLGDAFNRVTVAVKSTVFEIGAQLAPTIIQAAAVVKTIATNVQRWVKENSGLVKTIALVGAVLVAAGTAIVALGTAISLVGVIIGGVATAFAALGSIIGFLLSPLGLVVAALTAGLVMWARWTESGQRAMALVSSTLSEMGDTVRQTFGGIFDAIAAGDLELAGEIAMTGLQLIVLQGLRFIRQLFDNEFGDAIAAIGGQLLGGDFTGAWDTAISAMAAAWHGFTSWIVSAMAKASRLAVKVWAGSVKGIANWMLETSRGGGVMGKAMSAILGVDMEAEQARADKIQREGGEVYVRNLKGSLEEARKLRDAAVKAGNAEEAAQWQRSMENTQRELATFDPTAYGGDSDVVAGAMEHVDQIVDGWEQGGIDALDAWESAATDRAQEALARLQEKTDPLLGDQDEEIDALRQHLDDLAKLAAERREQARQAAQDRAAGPGVDAEAFGVEGAGGGGSTVVSFSAQALAAASRGGGPMAKMVREVERHRKVGEQQLEEQKKGNRQGGPVFQQP